MKMSLRCYSASSMYDRKADKDQGPTGNVMIKNQLGRQPDLKTMTFYTQN